MHNFRCQRAGFGKFRWDISRSSCNSTFNYHEAREGTYRHLMHNCNKCVAPGGMAQIHKWNGYKVSKESWNTFWLQNWQKHLISWVSRGYRVLTAGPLWVQVCLFQPWEQTHLFCVPAVSWLVPTPVLPWRPVPGQAASLQNWMCSTETSREMSPLLCSEVTSQKSSLTRYKPKSSHFHPSRWNAYMTVFPQK